MFIDKVSFFRGFFYFIFNRRTSVNTRSRILTYLTVKIVTYVAEIFVREQKKNENVKEIVVKVWFGLVLFSSR